MGFWDGIRGFIRWRDARNAQKKRFLIELADGEALAILQEVSELRADLKGHVDDYHGGKKPPRQKATIDKSMPVEASELSYIEMLKKAGLEV